MTGAIPASNEEDAQPQVRELAPVREGEEPFVLAGQQLAVYRALAEKDGRLAGWYAGARKTFADAKNPERFPQAAHSIRELMNNLHSIADVPVKADTGNLGSEFAVMTERWQRAQRTSDCYVGGRWEGEIDPAARRGFEAVEVIIEWDANNRPKRVEVQRLTIRSLDVSGRDLPGWIEDAFIRMWDEWRTFFIKVCHHGHETTEEEFSATLEELERFILDRLKPRTFTEQATLDELIAEAERGA